MLIVGIYLLIGFISATIYTSSCEKEPEQEMVLVCTILWPIVLILIIMVLFLHVPVLLGKVLRKKFGLNNE